MKMKPWIITGVSLLCAGAICCGAAVHAGALDQKRYMKMLDLTTIPTPRTVLFPPC